MISRHLIKMLLGLVGMGIFGILCLIVINLYYKDASQAQTSVSQTPATSTR